MRGQVRRVGFRRFVRSLANELELTGWVRNQGNTVVTLAQGPRAQLEQFVSALNEGPKLARVLDIEVSWSSVSSQLPSFEVSWPRWLRWLQG